MDEAHRPETNQEKKQRLLAQAKKKAAGKGDVSTKRPPVLQAGVNTVTTLPENKKAQLVVSLCVEDLENIWYSSDLGEEAPQLRNGGTAAAAMGASLGSQRT
ncbi:60S ribosomal protein L7a, partial [Plecturocebus cupreus]